MLVQLLQQARDARGARGAQVALLDEKVVSQVRLGDNRAVNHRERADAREHEVLERLGAGAGSVEQTDGAIFHRSLAVLAPQAQLPVVALPLLVVWSHRGVPCRGGRAWLDLAAEEVKKPRQTQP